MRILLAEAQSLGSGFSLSTSTFRSNQAGYERIALLAAQLEEWVFEDIELSFDSVTWFDANLCAPLGAVLYRAGRAPNRVRITDVSPRVAEILERNAFLSHYGYAKLPDRHQTTIPYQRLEIEDDRYFGEYIDRHLQGKDIPEMSTGLRKKFLESIFEVFSNSVIHSATEQGIYACGQFFPVRHTLDFSLADLGIGIRRNLKKNAGLDLPADQAIVWAVTGTNTTKKGKVPGGLGLKLLREFVTMNQGRIQIVSGRGFWELKGNTVNTQAMKHGFPGTVVNLELNTADTKSYCLASELTPEDIF